ncbi:MAG: hypothetical protein AAFQ07_08980, partial [Chloroflexota bacterium]
SDPKQVVILLSVWGQSVKSTPDRTAIEHSAEFKTTDFLREIAFPQRDRVLRFSNHHTKKGFESGG